MSRTILTKKQFFDYLNNNQLSGNAYTINHEVVIDSELISWNFRLINNIHFDEVVRINGELNSGLAFINCMFEKGIVFRNVTTKKFQSQHNTFNCSILFNNCKSNHITFADQCDCSRGVVIENHCEIDTLKFYYSTISGHSLKIDGSEISQLVDIHASTLVYLNIQNNSQLKSIRVRNVTADISILNSNIKGNVIFWNYETIRSLTLNHNTFADTFKIRGSRIKGFFIHGDSFQRKAYLENRDDQGKGTDTFLNELYITEATFVEGFEFDGMDKELDKFTLPLSPKINGVLRIVGWKIRETLISGINENLKLVFKRTDFKRLMLMDFSNSGDITFDSSGADNNIFRSDEDPNSSIIITDSDLGLTKFNEFDFDSFDFINLVNASFNGVIATNVEWFSDEKIQIESANIVSSKNLKRKREFYRQLKQSLQSQGNNIDSLIFRAREMKTYRDELVAQNSEYRQKKKNKEFLNPDKKYKWSDKVIMTVNQTNDYGLSWWKPIWIIALITFGFYIIELPLFSNEITYLPASSCDDIKATFDSFWNSFEVYWQMFNPARKFSAVYGTREGALLYFLDFFHRIIIGVFIYQIIKGFRRFATK